MTFFGPDLRNGLPIGLGSVAGFGIAPRFSPASLFAGGVNGAWYDPSDSTTLFSDRAGTTPCGTPGGGSVVPVGLMLDKSQGLVLGSELVTNGDFSGGTTTGWTPQSAALSVVGGQLSVVPSTTFGYAYQVLTTVVGTTYRLTFSFDQSTAAIARYFVGTSLGGGEIVALTTVSGVGSVSRYFTATTTTTFIHFGAQNSSGLQALFDNISVKALPGNHAIAANDTTARPELRARVNLLTYSEQFDNAAWDKLNGVTVSQNAAVAPDGTTTADKLIAPNSTGTVRAVRQALTSGVNGVSYVSSFYAKYVSGEFAWVRALATDAGVVWFDIQNGVRGTVTGVNTTGTITPVGNGWYRCVITSTASSINIYSYLNPVDADGSTTTTGDGSKGVLIWGAQLTATNEFPANTYQRIADQYTYDAVGFPRYLVANGTSSAMSTPGNVNLSGTDKATVFAGVRKLSDAAIGTVVELGNEPTTNTFGLFAPRGTPTPSYAFRSGGSTFRDADSATTFSAPTSNVLSGAGNIAAPSAVLRVNGVQVASNTSSQGTGNYANAALFIGARGTTSSLFFNGNIYSIIVVGSAVSAGQISATEQWVAGKVGITI